MQATRRLWQHRQPMIRFLGKRTVPKSTSSPTPTDFVPHPTNASSPTDVDHSPHAHPESPDHALPESFAQYRNRAIQHGPLGGQQQQSAQRGPSQAQSSAANGQPMTPYGGIGGKTGQELGSIQPAKGEVWDRDELPARFRRMRWTEAEMEAVDSGGASMFG